MSKPPFAIGSDSAPFGRRACLKRLLIAAPSVLALPTVLAQMQAAPGKLEHADDWLDSARQAVRPWLQDRSAEGEERFAAHLAESILSLKSVPTVQTGAMPGLQPAVNFGPLNRTPPVVVIVWEFEPHAWLPAHCHPGAVVVSMLLAGQLHMRHLETRGNVPRVDSGSADAFDLEETRVVRMRPGQTSTLTESRDNIHELRAGPDGARGIDLFTAYEPKSTFSFIRQVSRVDDRGRLRGQWVGMDPRAALA
jgi:hypothetical protein